jgi:transposase
LWARIEPLLPVVPRNPRRPGRKRLDSRKVLCGILFVLYTGEFLPQELGFGSGMTCWRRLRDWNEAGVWQRLHELLLSELRAADLLDFSRAAVDSSHIRAMKGGPATGPSPVDRGKAGSKHHLIVAAHGIPLAAITPGGNRNDDDGMTLDTVPKPTRWRAHRRRRGGRCDMEVPSRTTTLRFPVQARTCPALLRTSQSRGVHDQGEASRLRAVASGGISPARARRTARWVLVTSMP